MVGLLEGELGDLVRGRRVLELGSGTGLAGLAAALELCSATIARILCAQGRHLAAAGRPAGPSG